MKKIITTLAVAFCLNTNAQVCFNTDTNYVAGLRPTAIVSADFNNDGFKDLVVGDDSLAILSVLLGNGTGTFGTATSFTIQNRLTYPVTTALITADFNNDTKADLALADGELFLGTGTGNFTAGSSFNIGSKLPGDYQGGVITSADFNGDGKTDLAATNDSGRVTIALGTGTGSFGTNTTYTLVSGLPAGLGAMCIGAADFNNDGHLDIATSGYGLAGYLSIMLGTGTGSFGTVTNYSLSSSADHASSMVCTDFNGDGNVDLAMTAFDQGCVISLLGTGTGSFGTPTVHYTGDLAYWDMVCADFNGDGYKDLAIQNDGVGVSLELGTGTGSFGSVARFSTCPDTVGLVALLFCEDFNNDGKPDLVTNTKNHVAVLLNCTSAAGIESVYNKNSQVNIYPNPNNGQFTINSTGSSTLQIADALGKIIYQKNFTDNINVSESFASGIYYVSVRNSERTYNVKIIVAK